MADPVQIPRHRKRKRRRQDKSPITARLVLDDHVKGDVGILSEDLFADLFPAQAHGEFALLVLRVIIANTLQPKQMKTPPKMTRFSMLQSLPGDPPLLSKTQHGRSSLSDPRVLLHILQYNSLPHHSPCRDSQRPCKR